MVNVYVLLQMRHRHVDMVKLKIIGHGTRQHIIKMYIVCNLKNQKEKHL